MHKKKKRKETETVDNRIVLRVLKLATHGVITDKLVYTSRICDAVVACSCRVSVHQFLTSE